MQEDIYQTLKKLPLWFQFAAPLAMGILGMLITRAAIPEAYFEWRVAAVFLLMFTVINPVKGIFNKNWGKYTAISLGLFVSLYVALLFSADAFSLKPITEIGEYRLIYLVFVLFYFMLILMSLLYRTIHKLLKSMN